MDPHPHPRIFSTIVCVLVVAALAGCGSDGDAPPASEATPRWQAIEWSLPEVVVDENPFDEAGTFAEVDFEAPSGALATVAGFVARDYTRSLVGGYEKLAPLAPVAWRVRFTPWEEGRWRRRTRVTTPSGETVSPWHGFDVGPAAPEAHGLVRRSPRDPRYLEFDDGTSFFAVGENLCWYDGRGTYAYEAWLDRLQAQGANYVRLWMPSWAFGLEAIRRDGDTLSTTLGDYSARLDRAWQLDFVLDAARRRGIQVMLSLQSHGAFSFTNNSDWENNPYNAANGGPLLAPRDFFVSDEARALFKRRLHYIVARWGHAPNLIAWELWNEVDLVDQPRIEDLTAWHREMAGEIRRHDPYRHLVSTSTGQGDAISPASPFGALWALDEIDFVQAHFYAFGGAAADFTQSFPRIANRLQRYGKPMLVAEAGVDFRGPAETIAGDPEGDGFHDLLWQAPFVEAFGGGMTWWWDNVIDPLDLYDHFGALARFVAGIDFPAEGFVAARANVVTTGRTLRVASLHGRTVVLAWIKNAAHLWHSPDRATITGASVSLGGLADGRWRVRWLDTRGVAESSEVIEVASGTAVLVVPSFRRDIAVRLEREP